MRKPFLLIAIILLSISAYGQDISKIPVTDSLKDSQPQIQKLIENNVADALEAHALDVYSQRVLFGTGAPSGTCPTGKIYGRQSNGHVYGCASGTWADNFFSGSVSDSSFRVQDNGDATKQLAFEVSGITTGTTRTITVPDSNTTLPIASQILTFAGPTAARTITLPDAAFTVARTDAANVWTGHQTFSTDNTYDIGTSGGSRPRDYYGGGLISIGGNVAIGNSSSFNAGNNARIFASTGEFRTRSAGLYEFSSDTTGFGTADTGIARNAASVVEINNGTAGQSGVLLLRGRTFANLPASPVAGMIATVTDSNTITWGATIAGGGANTVLAFYSGANWTVAGK
jgi:hypothetical protein